MHLLQNLCIYFVFYTGNVAALWFRQVGEERERKSHYACGSRRVNGTVSFYATHNNHQHTVIAYNRSANPAEVCHPNPQITYAKNLSE